MGRRKLVMAAGCVALVAVLGIVAYAAWFHLAPGTARAEKVGNDPIILVWQQRYSGMEALLTGTLRYDAATKCLTIEDDYDGSIWGIVWQKGTSPAKVTSERGVRIDGFIGRFGGTTLLEGDRLELVGGAIDVSARPLAESPCSYGSVWRASDVELIGQT